MKFGIFHIVQWHESRSPQEALGEAMEQIELAERLGIEEAWLGEHRFSRHGLLSGIFSFVGYVAARTSRIRIGTAVVVLPFHNPILVAEEVAMLDILSGGRLDFGVGSGYQRQEFEGVGVNVDEGRERFREHLDVITRAWTEERLTFHGKYTNVDDLVGNPQAAAKAAPAAVHRGEYEPRQRRVRRQTKHSHHRRWPHGRDGPGPSRRPPLAREDGGVRPRTCAHRPAGLDEHLRGAHHGGGRDGPARARGFFDRDPRQDRISHRRGRHDTAWI